MFKGRDEALILLGFLGGNVEFTPLEDRIGSQDIWKLQGIRFKY